MFKRILFALAIIALLLAACAPRAAPTQSIYNEAVGVAPESPALGAPAFEGPPAPGERQPIVAVDQATSGIEQANQATDRIVIKNANLEIVVDKPDKSLDRISRMAEEMGGFVVTANLYQSYLENGQEVPRGSITIRVPAERLNEAIAHIEGESDRLPLNKSINSQDVTSEYTDLESRLRNLEAAEKQLTQIMEEAKRTEDVLAVYNQLVSTREQIEVIKGQIKYYDESAALSAISTELIANEAVQPITGGDWQPLAIIKDAIQALINALQFLVNAGIWIILFLLPVLIVIVLPIYIIVRLILRARARRKAKRQALQPPSEPAQS